MSNIHQANSLLENDIIGLLSSSENRRGEVYYGHLILNMRRIFTNRVPTAGVNVTDRINLYVNPDFWLAQNREVRRDVLKHECGHIMNAHILRAENYGMIKKGDNSLNALLTHQIFNIAADAAINEPLKNLHEFGVTQDKLAKQIKNLKKNETMEYYYEQLRSDPDIQKVLEAGSLGEILDDHSLWEEGEQNQELAKQIIRHTVNKAVKNCGGIGNVPGDVALAIEKLNASTVNWKQQLRQFFQRTRNINVESTRKKRNRRHGLLFAGKKKKPEAKIAVAVDASGSMSYESLVQVFSEVDKICDIGVNVIVIEADCDITQIYEYKKGMKINVKGRGGTAYTPAFEAAKELEVDGLIYMGDMDCADTPEKPKFPTLWAVVGEQNPPVEWGTVCRIKLESEN